MLGLDDYNSGSDDEQSKLPSQVKAKSKSTLLSQLPPTTKKASSVANGHSTKKELSGLNLPPPTAKKSGAKKIVLDFGKAEGDGFDDVEPEQPVAKKPRLTGPSGASSLLSMLPAPKKSTSELSAPLKVLGSGSRPALNFSSRSHISETPVSTSPESKMEEKGEDDGEELEEKPTTSTSMLPPSLLKSMSKSGIAKGATGQSDANGASSKKLPAIDFFSLGTSSTSRSVQDELSSSGASTSSITVSAAPKVEEYRPPSPTQDDPYPGYYQQPDGQWAMYDPEYYKKYSTRWQEEYEIQMREYQQSLKRERGFEDADRSGMVDVDAGDQLDAARKEREEKKALTKGTARESEPKAPSVTINATKLSGIAKSRHQLHSLLADAYNNREALEEKIAQARRNRKEAGNKYGF